MSVATFAPPTVEGNSVMGPPGHPLNPLLRFYGGWAQSATVWKDSLGAWHQSTAPYLGGATTTVHDWDGSTYTTPDEGLATAQKVYLGGHVHTISEAEADEVAAAGYGSGILTRQSIAESFNGPDAPGAGPDLSWEEAVFASQPFGVNRVGNQLWYYTSAPGSWEEIQVPTPNVDSPNVTASMQVVNSVVSGTGDHHVGVGFIARWEPFSGGTDYRGYACEISRTETFFPGVELWILIIWRIASRLAPTLLAFDAEPFADVTMPGTLTFTANGSSLSASFAHGGIAPTLTAAATDSTYPDGRIALGWGHVQSGDEAATTIIDNFQAGPP